MFRKIFSTTLLASLALTGAASAASYNVLRKIPIPGDGGWDLLTIESSTGRIFLSHSTQVQVVDEKTGTVIGTIPDMKGAHGIALAPEFKKGFITNGKDSSVTVFDLDSLKTITKVQVTGLNPDVILYDAASKKVFVFNGKSNNATVIDAATNAVVATIALEGKPEMAVSDGKGTIYLNLEDKNKVAIIDSKTLKVTGSFSIVPGDSPSGLAIDVKNNLLFLVCDNKMMVVADAKKQKVVTTLPIGERPDGDAFDPATMRAFSSNGEGTLTVVQEKDSKHFAVLENVPTQKGARTIALDPVTHHVFMPTAQFGPAPQATAENPKPRPVVVPNSFVLLDVGE